MKKVLAVLAATAGIFTFGAPAAQAQDDPHYLTGAECGARVVAGSRPDFDYVRSVFGYPNYYGSTFGYGGSAIRHNATTINCGAAHQAYRSTGGWLSCGYRATVYEGPDGREYIRIWTSFRECVGS